MGTWIGTLPRYLYATQPVSSVPRYFWYRPCLKYHVFDQSLVEFITDNISRHSGHLSLPLYSHGVILRFKYSFKFSLFLPFLLLLPHFPPLPPIKMILISRHDEEPAGRGEAGDDGDQHSALAGQVKVIS